MKLKIAYGVMIGFTLATLILLILLLVSAPADMALVFGTIGLLALFVWAAVTVLENGQRY